MSTKMQVLRPQGERSQLIKLLHKDLGVEEKSSSNRQLRMSQQILKLSRFLVQRRLTSKCLLSFPQKYRAEEVKQPRNSMSFHKIFQMIFLNNILML
ncbi:hypothetical protein Droror1_Dr00025313 [Drosera rotundifolia]